MEGVRIQRQRKLLSVQLSGTITFEEHRSILRSIIDKVGRWKISKVIFDMKECVYINSAGCMVILNVYKTMRDTQGEVEIHDPCESVLSILKALTINDIIPIQYSTAGS